jgi:hypothetical protein
MRKFELLSSQWALQKKKDNDACIYIIIYVFRHEDDQWMLRMIVQSR